MISKYFVILFALGAAVPFSEAKDLKVSFISPTAGEVLERGKPFEIRWDTNNIAHEIVNIWLTSPDGVLHPALTGNVPLKDGKARVVIPIDVPDDHPEFQFYMENGGFAVFDHAYSPVFYVP